MNTKFRLIIFVFAAFAVLAAAQKASAQYAGAAFTPGPNMTEPKMLHYIATLSDGRVAVFGGHTTGFVASGTANFYSPVNKTFTSQNMIYTHDYNAFVRLADGRFLLAGGAADLGVAPGYKTAEIFNPLTGVFTATGNMNHGRLNCLGARLTSGKALIVGGWYDAISTTYAEVFDPTTEIFTNTSALNTPRSHPLVLPASDGTAVVCGGRGAYGNPDYQQIEKYDPSTNAFTVVRETLFDGEEGWYTQGTAYQRAIDDQIMPDGRYLLLAYKPGATETEYTLFTFDPSDGSIAKFATSPALPGSLTLSYIAPVVDNAKSRAYLLAQTPFTELPVNIKLLSVNLTTGALTVPTGTHDFPDNNYTGYSAHTLLANGQLFITGGYSPDGGTNFSPIANTLFAAPGSHVNGIPSSIQMLLFSDD